MHTNLMKIVSVLLCSVLLATPAFAAKNHQVRGHVNKNGTYVAPHKQTNPNRTQRDNWGAKNNTNPYTGKHGQKEPAR